MRYHVNGDLVPAEEATVRVDDRGFRYGDAAFETLRAYGGTVFAWEAHADRLRSTCDLLGIDHGISDDDLRDRIDDTLAANDLADAYVRLSITRGVQPGKLTPRPTTDPTVVIVVADLPRGGVEGDPVWDGPAAVEPVDVQKIPDAALPARAKTHNYLNGILARLDAPDADEVLLCDTTGFVAEGSTSNLFFVRDGVLCTPGLDGPVLPGITRKVVVELAGREDIAVEEGSYALADVRAADECFVTNSTWEVRPVERLGGTTYDVGPITTRLAGAFDEHVEAHHY